METKTRKYKWGKLMLRADMAQASCPIQVATPDPGQAPEWDSTPFQVADARHSWPEAFAKVNDWRKYT